MACPYFVPREILQDGSWQHPDRLPLGAGWIGGCCASREVKFGGASDVISDCTPGDAQLLNLCNLGYAVACPHLPAVRDWDAVRFAIARASSEHITLSYACERSHAPVLHGTLRYDLVAEAWSNPHPDPRVHRLAGSYLHALRIRQNGAFIEPDTGKTPVSNDI